MFVYGTENKFLKSHFRKNANYLSFKQVNKVGAAILKIINLMPKSKTCVTQK